MGRVRAYAYDAVIGIGGIGAEPKSFDIDRKLNWVGIAPRRPVRGNGVVTFEHFVLFDENGPLLKELAPRLARRMYGRNARILLDGYSAQQQAEAEEVLRWSRGHSAEQLNGASRAARIPGCGGRCRPAAPDAC